MEKTAPHEDVILFYRGTLRWRGIFPELTSMGITTLTNKCTFYAECMDYKPDTSDEKGYQSIFPPDQETVLVERKPKTIPGIYSEKGYIVEIKDRSDVIRDKLFAWLESQSTAASGANLRFVKDSSYEWNLLFNLLRLDPNELEIAEYIYPTPFDMSTLLRASNVSPEIDRETYARYTPGITRIVDGSTSIPRNSTLWDAKILQLCYRRWLDDLPVKST